MRAREFVTENMQSVARRSLHEFYVGGGDDGEDPLDAYPCYDCGSTIFLHHTQSCDLAEPNAIRDLPEEPGTQYWTGEIPKGLHPIPGLQEGLRENSDEDATRAEAQAAYMQGQCMILAVAINLLNPTRYPIGYIWEYNVSAGIPDMQLDDDEWESLSPQEQQEISKDISRHSVVHAYVRDRETGEYIDARGRHKTLPNLWGRLGQTRFDEFPGTARELIAITAHGFWDEVGEQVSFKRGLPAFDSLAGPAGIKRAQDYAVKYLGVESSKNKAPGTDQQGVAEGWRENLAAAGIAGALSMGTPAQAQVQPTASADPIVATVVIDGEQRRLDLSAKNFGDVRQAEQWLAKFMRDRGIRDWQGKIERGEPGSGRYQRVTIQGAGGLNEQRRRS